MAESPSPRPLLEALPRDVAEGGHLPFAFRILPPDAGEPPECRADASAAYHARASVCLPAPKPITRCFGPEP